MIRRPTETTQFPCTTLFRSVLGAVLDPLHGAAILARQPSRQNGLDLHARLDAEAAAHVERHHAHARGSEAELLGDRKSTRMNSSHANILYAVFCLKETCWEL